MAGDEYKSSREKIGLLEKDYYILTTWMEIFTGLHQESREAADAIAKIYSEIPEKIKGYIKSFRESLDFKETNDDFIENIEDYILEKSVFVMKALFIMHEIESIVKGTVYVNSDYPEEIEGPLTAIFASLKDLYAPLPIVPEAPFLTLSAKVKPTLVVTVEKVAEEQAVSFKGKSGKKTKKQELWVPTEKSSSEMSRHELESSHPFSTDLPRSTRKLLTFLEKLGFRLSRVKGDHAILKLKGKRGQVVIPVARDEQSLGTLKSIGRQAEEALRGKPAAAD